MKLSAGFHTLSSRDRWVALTPPNVTPVSGMQQNLQPVNTSGPTELSGTVGTITAADQDRLLIVPESTNPGRKATIAGRALTATSVDGWQQAWIVPAGLSGEVTISFPADKWYRLLLATGFGAIALVIAWLVLIIRHHRVGVARFPFADFDDFSDLTDPADYFTDPVSDRFPTGIKTTMLSVMLGVIASLTAGIGGLATAAAVLAIHALVSWRWGLHRAHHLSVLTAMTAVSVAGLILSRNPWPQSDYSGDSWIPQLLCVVSIAAVFVAHVLPTHRRAGSSTNA